MKMNAKNRAISLLSFGLALTAALAAGPAGADDQISAGRTLLQQRCYKCHGDGGHFSGKFNLNDSVQSMVDKGILAYGDPEHSLLYQKVRDQDMPADGNYLNTSELAEVSGWIQSLKPADPTPSSDASTLSDDQAVALTKNFLNNSVSNESANYRIFSLVDLARQGKSADELEIYRQALAKAVNSLSLKKALMKPTAIDQGRLLLAVNIKDLGWDPQVWTEDFAQPGCNAAASTLLNSELQEVLDICRGTGRPNSSNLDDRELLENFEESSRDLSVQGCDLIAVESSVSYSVVARRPGELDITNCSVLPVDTFVVLATRQKTYEQLVLQPLSRDRGETVEGVLKAGFNQGNSGFLTLGIQSSGVALHNRVIFRKKDFPGYYWGSRDFTSDLDKEDLTRHPNAHPDAGEFIFSLPNGMQGYMIANGQNELIPAAQTSIAVNPIRIDQIVSRPDSCMQCHGNIGIIPKGSSEVLPNGFSNFDDVKHFFTTDSNTYQAALKQIGAYRADSIEPVTYVLKNILSHDYK